MLRCAVKRGFLTLRECGEPALATCSSCGRPTCAEHMVGVEADGPVCVECSASQSLSDDSSSSSIDSGYVGTGAWSHSYRDSFYQDSGYSPRSTDGFATGGSFDELDKAAFDRTLADAGAAGELDEGPSLLDS